MTSRLPKALISLTFISTALGGCVATVDEARSAQSEASPASALSDPRYADLDNPTKITDLPQTASVLEVERYRPTYALVGGIPFPPQTGQADPELAEAIRKAQEYSEAQKGLGLIILKDGETVHESFAEGVDRFSQSASASMMKSVVALLYGIAIEDGVIGSIDDRVGLYLLEWSDDPRGDITLRQMLTMSAGFGQSDFMEILLAPDIGPAALQLEQVAEPDSEFAYNNAITKLLTMVLDRQLQKAGKGGFLTFLDEQLWARLGNGSAMVWVDQKGKARGYAGLHAGLADWARVGELIRNQGRVGDSQIVPAAWIAEMAKPSKANAQYGLHVWLGTEWTERRRYSVANPITIPHAEPFVADDIIYFDGFGGQRVYIIPSKQLVIARFGEVNLAYDDSVISNLLVRALN